MCVHIYIYIYIYRLILYLYNNEKSKYQVSTMARDVGLRSFSAPTESTNCAKAIGGDNVDDDRTTTTLSCIVSKQMI